MNKVSNITFGGILAALSIIFIYLASILPTNKIALLTLTSFIIIACILITGMKNAFIIYIAVALLSFIFSGSKGIAFTYVAFFGPYSFIKHYIERIQKLPLEIILKLVFFNAAVALLFLIYKTLFMGPINLSNIRLPYYGLIIILQGAFLVYDYLLTLFVSYFNNKLMPKFKK